MENVMVDTNQTPAGLFRPIPGTNPILGPDPIPRELNPIPRPNPVDRPVLAQEDPEPEPEPEPEPDEPDEPDDIDDPFPDEPDGPIVRVARPSDPNPEPLNPEIIVINPTPPDLDDIIRGHPTPVSPLGPRRPVQDPEPIPITGEAASIDDGWLFVT
jgi:hypothetical protein